MKTTLLPLLATFAFSFITHAEPPELKQHRDARAKQALQAAVERQDGNLEWRLKRFDANQDGVLDRKELAVEQTAKDKQINEAAKRLDQRESARRQQGDLHRFDRNRNGRLDPAERLPLCAMA